MGHHRGGGRVESLAGCHPVVAERGLLEGVLWIVCFGGLDRDVLWLWLECVVDLF